jgi:hypothetical protein
VKRLLIATIAALALAGQASASDAWKGNAFTSPSRNILCNYSLSESLSSIACFARNNGRVVVLLAEGGKAFKGGSRSDRPTPFTPVLPYGQTWTAPRLQCKSTTAYMACRSSFGHGFSISRNSIRTW